MQENLTLPEVAEQLGVHYMTVYRYVRTGRLPAAKDGAEYRVRQADVDALRAAPAPRAARRGRRTATGRHARQLEQRLLAGDEAAAWSLVEDALTGGLEPAQVHLDLLAPALVSIGDRWESGDVTVAQEHLASAVAQRIIGRLGPRFTRRGRKRGTIVVGAAPGDLHGLPSALLGDLLRARGFAVVDLGADPPAASWAEAAAGAERLVAVAMCATTSGNERAVRAAARAIRDVVSCPILVGGRAIEDEAHALRLGADLHGDDAVAVLGVLEAVVTDR
jgi:excisionase family DNA binding protein